MRSYTETLNYIFNLRGGEIDLKLHRVEQALALLDHPERRYRAFHIAGTNGKGSTAAMLHRILSAQGYRAALYTSPHVVSFTERIRIGGREISPEEVVEIAALIDDRLARAGIALTFFEFVTAMAFVYFAWSEVEVAVVEVGLGGRLDATNLVLPEVSVITTIAKDHEAYLGSDILSIAREKGGIIKEGVPLVGGALVAEVEGLLRGIADAKNAECFFLGRDFFLATENPERFDYRGLERDLADLSLGLRGCYQRRNAAVALAALEVARQAFPVSEEAIREGLQTVFWPGRFEVISERPRVILDGAHNGEGVSALVKEIRQLRRGKKVRLLFAAMADKDWPRMLAELSTVAAEVVFARAPMARSADPSLLSSALSPRLPFRIIESPLEAARFLLQTARPDDTILVAGSLYLLGEVRPWLLSQAGSERVTKTKPVEA
ncbi:MAG: bifunctional folylpolyglutamate synthase/dihydrofolate synthase [Deltaproteobacteria bacterium]|nr:bifunctional folylpolyglutamate synthase/dihydrofolate synthase [Deltaproteobacteria bacterium]